MCGGVEGPRGGLSRARQVSVYNNTITNTCREDVWNQLQPFVPEFKRDVRAPSMKISCALACVRVHLCFSMYQQTLLLIGCCSYLSGLARDLCADCTGPGFLFPSFSRLSYLCNGYLQTNVHSVSFLCLSTSHPRPVAAPGSKLCNFQYSEQSFNTLRNNVVLFVFVLEYL